MSRTSNPDGPCRLNGERLTYAKSPDVRRSGINRPGVHATGSCEHHPEPGQRVAHDGRLRLHLRRYVVAGPATRSVRSAGIFHDLRLRTGEPGDRYGESRERLDIPDQYAAANPGGGHGPKRKHIHRCDPRDVYRTGRDWAVLGNGQDNLGTVTFFTTYTGAYQIFNNDQDAQLEKYAPGTPTNDTITSNLAAVAIPTQPSPVPEPLSVAILGTGLLSLGIMRRAKRS